MYAIRALASDASYDTSIAVGGNESSSLTALRPRSKRTQVSSQVSRTGIEHFEAPSYARLPHPSLTLPWPSLRRNRDLLVPSTGHLSPLVLRARSPVRERIQSAPRRRRARLSNDRLAEVSNAISMRNGNFRTRDGRARHVTVFVESRDLTSEEKRGSGYTNKKKKNHVYRRVAGRNRNH